MTNPMGQALNRTLFIADNLPVLRGIDSDSVDLIATDPPFNKGVRAFEGITAAGENVSYSDVWTWSDVQAEWTNRILGDHPALYNVIQAANAAAGDDMGAFLCWLGVRVIGWSPEHCVHKRAAPARRRRSGLGCPRAGGSTVRRGSSG